LAARESHHWPESLRLKAGRIIPNALSL